LYIFVILKKNGWIIISPASSNDCGALVSALGYYEYYRLPQEPLRDEKVKSLCWRAGGV
jgi:hypothetical protein